MSVNVEPKAAIFKPNTVCLASIRMKNTKEHILGVKVFCSDNAIYRIKPTYACLKPGQEKVLDIARTAAPGKLDRLVVQSRMTPVETDDVESLFLMAGAPPAQLQVNLCATDGAASLPQAQGGASAFPLPEADLKDMETPPPAA